MTSSTLCNQPPPASPLAIKFELSHDSQAISPLFRKLIPEIRNKIFDYALTFEPLEFTIINIESLSPEPRKKADKVHSRLALLQSCRTIYIETHQSALQLNTIAYNFPSHNIFHTTLLRYDLQLEDFAELRPWQW